MTRSAAQISSIVLYEKVQPDMARHHFSHVLERWSYWLISSKLSVGSGNACLIKCNLLTWVHFNEFIWFSVCLELYQRYIWGNSFVGARENIPGTSKPIYDKVLKGLRRSPPGCQRPYLMEQTGCRNSWMDLEDLGNKVSVKLERHGPIFTLLCNRGQHLMQLKKRHTRT